MRGWVCAVVRPRRLASGLLAALLVAHSSRFAGKALAGLDKLQTQQSLASGSGMLSWQIRTGQPGSGASRSSGGSSTSSSVSGGAEGLAALATLPRPAAGAGSSTADVTANPTPLHQKGDVRALRIVRASADDAGISDAPKANEGSNASNAGSPISDSEIAGSTGREIGDPDSPDTGSSAADSSGPGRRGRARQASIRTDAHSAVPDRSETGTRGAGATQLGSSASDLAANGAATSGSGGGGGSGSVRRRLRSGVQQLPALGDAPQPQAGKEPKGDSRQAESPGHIVGGLPARHATLWARSNINFPDPLRRKVLRQQQYIYGPSCTTIRLLAC